MDEEHASADARSARASLLHLWKPSSGPATAGPVHRGLAKSSAFEPAVEHAGWSQIDSDGRAKTAGRRSQRGGRGTVYTRAEGR
jgi:hypothetical protein